MAAFADGAKHDTERAELKRIAERLPHADVQPMALYQRVLLKQVTEQARSMHSRYADDIQQKAGAVNVSQLLPLIRGQ